MNCQNARQLLEFARPQGFDLDAEDRSALDAHLAGCPECDALLRGKRQFDAQLTTALLDVPAPKGLSDRIKARLRRERDAWWRQQMGRVSRYAAAAAAVFLALFLGFSLVKEHLPRPPADDAIEEISAGSVSPPDEVKVRQYFAAKRESVVPPPDFNYAFLRSYSLTELQKKPVPYLLFIRPASPDNAAATAEIYILRSDRFNLADIPYGVTDMSGDRFKVRVERQAKELAYVIVYTGNLNDLRHPPAQAQ